jgi:hypothetical protein
MNAVDEQREGLEELAREAERIVTLILHTSLPRVDIEIQIENFREDVLRRYPGSEALFEMIYGSRFRRIWDQWLADRPPLDPEVESAWEA